MSPKRKAPSKSPPKTTPVKPHANTIHTHGSTALRAHNFRAEYASEAIGMFVGPMPHKVFLDMFLPQDHGMGRKTKPVTFQDVPVHAAVEVDLYDPLVKELNKCCPGFEFFVSASKGDAGVKIRPDIGMRNLSKEPYANSSRSKDVFDWTRCELSCEVKREANVDPFEDNNLNSVENLGDTARSHRGQLLTYYKEQAVRQQRTFIFQLFIIGPFARFLRWDRSGAVVSTKFNYQNEPDALAGFVRRYVHADTPRERGWDTTKTLASDAEERLFTQQIKVFLNIADIKKNTAAESNTPSGHETSSVPHLRAIGATAPRLRPALPIKKAERRILNSKKILKGDYPTYRIQLTRISRPVNSLQSSANRRSTPTQATSSSTTLIFRRPIYEPLSPFGRSTRGYFAYDKAYKAMLFLKDTWRIVHPNPERETEGALCQRLQSLGIRLVPTVLAHGDYQEDGKDQKTLTDDVPKQKWNLRWRRGCTQMRPHIHHYVLQEVLYPLTSFKNSRELVKIQMDVLTTIHLVHDKAGILHRDISIGNIMINANGEGVLGDWDNHGPVEPSNGDHPPFRTGTWQFMAIDLLEEDTYNKLRHDVESASIWVLLYTALHYLPHNQPRFDMRDVFDSMNRGDGVSRASGGHRKETFLTRKQWKTLEFSCKPLNALFDEIFRDWTELYSSQTQMDIFPALKETYEKKLAEINNKDYLIKKFKAAYDSDGWPEDDKLPDQFPRTTEKQQVLNVDIATRDEISREDPVSATDNDSAPAEDLPAADEVLLDNGSDSSLADWLYDSAPHLKEPSALPRTPPPRPQRDSSLSESQSSSDFDDRVLPTSEDKGKRDMRGTGLRREEPSPTPPARQPTTRRTTRPVGIGLGRPAQASSQGAGPSNAPATGIAPAAAPTDTQKRKVSQVDSTHSPKGAQKRGKSQKARKGKGKERDRSKRR